MTTVKADWDDTGWWVVTVPDIPGAFTQVKRLREVPTAAAEVIHIQTGTLVNPDDLDVVFVHPTASPFGCRCSRTNLGGAA